MRFNVIGFGEWLVLGLCTILGCQQSDVVTPLDPTIIVPNLDSAVSKRAPIPQFVFAASERAADNRLLDPERPEFLMYYEMDGQPVLSGIMFVMPDIHARGPQIRWATNDMALPY